MSFVSREGQEEKAKKSDKARRQREVDDVKALLTLTHGRRFLWRVLSEAKVFHGIWDPSARIHYNAGVQEFGQFIMKEIIEANPDALLQMMKEAKDNEGELNV